MRWISTLAAATLLTLAAGQVQAGPLTGQSLTIDWGATPPTAVVGSGIEFSTFTINWDFGEDGSLTISTTAETQPEAWPANIPPFIFSDTNGTIENITGITLDSTTAVTGLTSANISYTGNSVAINISDTVWQPGGVANLTITFGPVSQPTEAPEPAALALLGVGLTGLGAAVRRRRRA